MPFCMLTAWANCGPRLAMASMNFSMTLARSAGDNCGQPLLSKAVRAAATAASMSASTPSGTVAMRSPVEALMISKTLWVEGLTHWFPMKNAVRSKLIVSLLNYSCIILASLNLS